VQIDMRSEVTYGRKEGRWKLKRKVEKRKTNFWGGKNNQNVDCISRSLNSCFRKKNIRKKKNRENDKKIS